MTSKKPGSTGASPSPERVIVLRHLRQVAARGVLTGSLMSSVGIGCVDRAPGPSCRDTGVHGASSNSALWVNFDGGLAIQFSVFLRAQDAQVTVGAVTGADVATGSQASAMTLLPHAGVTSITVELNTVCAGTADTLRFRLDLGPSDAGPAATITVTEL